MDLAELTARASAAMAGGGDFKKKVKFDFGSAGKLLIDGVNNIANNSDDPADATISVNWSASWSTWVDEISWRAMNTLS